jgi:rhodanese-related sulfurtransferase
MENLKLPHPHRIAEALPGNLRSGWTVSNPPGESWAPLRRSYAGLPELPVDWVAEHHSELTLLDVRSGEEFNGPDGHIPGSRLIPLPELQGRSKELPGDGPVVVVCHAGSRSALATQQLLREGRHKVANLRGGISQWQAEGYTVEHSTPG